MPVLINRGAYGVTPPVGSTIEAGHPLAPRVAFLFNEGAGPTTLGLGIPPAVATFNNNTDTTWHPLGLNFNQAAGTGLSTPGTPLSFANISVAVWVSRYSTGSSDRDIINCTGDSLIIRVYNDNTPTAVVQSSTYYEAHVGGITLPLKQMSLLVLTYAPSDFVRLYMNGVLLASTATSATARVGMSTSLFIGKHRTTTTSNWDGQIGSVCLYDRVITGDEVLRLYAEPYCFVRPPSARRIYVSTGVLLQQEGYRWRNDDGSEATATWEGSQDSNVTGPIGETKRLRVLIDKGN